jgi:superfamily I DNA/RNA helicase
MPITAAQIAQAEQRQWQAARDGAAQVRLVAGPGTGKSATIERRVAHVLNNGANAQHIYVISFTRATCADLAERLRGTTLCSSGGEYSCFDHAFTRASDPAKSSGVSYAVPRRSNGFG